MAQIVDVKNNIGKLLQAREALLASSVTTFNSSIAVMRKAEHDLRNFQFEIQAAQAGLEEFAKSLAMATPEHLKVTAPVLPRDYHQVLRPAIPHVYASSKVEINSTEMMVGAVFIPQPLKEAVIFGQVVPWWFLHAFGPPMNARDGGLLFARGGGLLNRRATKHAMPAAGHIYSAAYWVPAPYRYEMWHAITVCGSAWSRLQEPHSGMEQTPETLHSYVLEVVTPSARFTVDELPRSYRDSGPRFCIVFEDQADAAKAKLFLC